MEARNWRDDPEQSACRNMHPRMYYLWHKSSGRIVCLMCYKVPAICLCTHCCANVIISVPDFIVARVARIQEAMS